MCRAFLHRIPLLPFPFGHASILTVFSLRFSHHGNLPGTITLWALRSLEPRSTYRAVFSGHCHSLWGETGTAHISRERPCNWWNRPDSNWWLPDPKSGALYCAELAFVTALWGLQPGHPLRPASATGTATSNYRSRILIIARNRPSPRYEPLPNIALCPVFRQPANTSSKCALDEDLDRRLIAPGGQPSTIQQLALQPTK